MTLSAFLLGSKKAQADTELDALFKTTPPAPSTSAGPSKESRKKRKQDAPVVSERSTKKSRKDGAGAGAVEGPSSPTSLKPKESKREGKAGDNVEKDKKEKNARVLDDSEEDEEDNADLEDAYLVSKTKHRGKIADKAAEAGDDGEEGSDEDEEEDTAPPVHESLLGGKTHSKKKAPRYVPLEETSERRDDRTVFVGNVPVEVAKNKSALKQFKRHILSFAPTAKIESTRFRSVAFQKPTTKLTEEPSASATTPAQASTSADGRAHERARAAEWRATNEDYDADKDPAKKRLTPQEKKRIAFIKHEIHDEAGSVHAYVVFAHPSAAPRAANLPQIVVMDPYDAASAVVAKADGSVFLERTLRVDKTKKGGDKRVESEGMKGDPKRTVFVGNLDFASREEDLRVFFEQVVVAERGARSADAESDEDDEEDEEKKTEVGRPKTWVARVRIIRDKDTQLGKGFAYVQFADRECVDEILAMEEGKLKFAKRKLRVQRCKTLPGGAKAKPSTPGAKAPASAKPAVPRPQTRTPVVIPKGNPLLGEKLAHLPKEQRKEVKASDADRVARRLAKKKARNALVKAGVKEQNKGRERVRKTPLERKAAPKHEQKKGRVRSEKSLTKRNGKK
ncbi:hypothetical protein OF83DRAFT_1175533 [Amylostereum chailletii]|nr:hypothetical protein OF83DRAFT_1175533 [Amylostereum chailletii]